MPVFYSVLRYGSKVQAEMRGGESRRGAGRQEAKIKVLNPP